MGELESLSRIWVSPIQCDAAQYHYESMRSPQEQEEIESLTRDKLGAPFAHHLFDLFQRDCGLA